MKPTHKLFAFIIFLFYSLSSLAGPGGTGGGNDLEQTLNRSLQILQQNLSGTEYQNLFEGKSIQLNSQMDLPWSLEGQKIAVHPKKVRDLLPLVNIKNTIDFLIYIISQNSTSLRNSLQEQLLQKKPLIDFIEQPSLLLSNQQQVESNLPPGCRNSLMITAIENKIILRAQSTDLCLPHLQPDLSVLDQNLTGPLQQPILTYQCSALNSQQISCRLQTQASERETDACYTVPGKSIPEADFPQLLIERSGKISIQYYWCRLSTQDKVIRKKHKVVYEFIP